MQPYRQTDRSSSTLSAPGQCPPARPLLHCPPSPLTQTNSLTSCITCRQHHHIPTTTNSSSSSSQLNRSSSSHEGGVRLAGYLEGDAVRDVSVKAEEDGQLGIAGPSLEQQV